MGEMMVDRGPDIFVGLLLIMSVPIQESTWNWDPTAIPSSDEVGSSSSTLSRSSSDTIATEEDSLPGSFPKDADYNTEFSCELGRKGTCVGPDPQGAGFQRNITPESPRQAHSVPPPLPRLWKKR